MDQRDASCLAIHLIARPDGPLCREQFAFVETRLPRLRPGSVLVRNLCVSIEPQPTSATTRGWLLHTPVRAGYVVGRVIGSRSADLPTGNLVVHREGWATHTVLAAGGYLTRVIDPPPGIAPSSYLSVLGLPGLTAYAGLVEILALKPGESVYVAGAADPVGMAAAQLARLRGAAYVLGGVASPRAAALVAADPRFDAVLEHRGTRAPGTSGGPARLDAALIGTEGPYLSDALSMMREFGRIAWAHGSAADTSRPTQVPGISAVHERSIRVDGFQVRHHLHLQKQVEALLTRELLAGRLTDGRTVDLEFSGLIDALVETSEAGYCGVDAFVLAR
jgi:NADPH-dependent curcumin reductase CurA